MSIYTFIVFIFDVKNVYGIILLYYNIKIFFYFINYYILPGYFIVWRDFYNGINYKNIFILIQKLFKML